MSFADRLTEGELQREGDLQRRLDAIKEWLPEQTYDRAYEFEWWSELSTEDQIEILYKEARYGQVNPGK